MFNELEVVEFIKLGWNYRQIRMHYGLKYCPSYQNTFLTRIVKKYNLQHLVKIQTNKKKAGIKRTLDLSESKALKVRLLAPLAVEMQKKGYSYKEIARKLKIGENFTIVMIKNNGGY